MSVSPGVAGLDRLRSSGLYLGGVGLNPPTSPWSFLSWPEDRRAPFWRMDGRESLLFRSRAVPGVQMDVMSSSKPVEY